MCDPDGYKKYYEDRANTCGNLEVGQARDSADFDGAPISTALDTTFDHEKLVSFKGNSANCLVFE